MRQLKVSTHAARIAALCAATALIAGQAGAQVTGRFFGNVSVRGGYATNPFLSANDGNLDSPYVEVAVAPSYILSEPTATTELTGNFRLTEYLDHYSASESYGLSAMHRRQLDQFTDADLSLQFDSSVLGEQEILLGIPGEPDFPDPTDPTDPGTPADNPDLALVGSAQRTTQLSVNGSIRHRLSAVDSVSIGGGASKTWYERNSANDYRSYNTSLSYTRTLSDRSTAGLSMYASWSDYEAGVPDSRVFRPQATYTRRLSSTLSLDLALGAQFIRGGRNGGDVNGFSGNFDLCRTTVRSSLCLNGSRDTTTSGIGGVREQTSAGVNYSYRLAEYDTLRASARYNKQGGSGLASGNDFVSSDIAWERRLNERLLGGVNVAYRDIYSSRASTAADFNVQVYVRYNLGQLR